MTGVKNPIFEATAKYGHMGREPYTEKVVFDTNGSAVKKEVEFFTWEKLDYVKKIQKEFGIS